LIGSPGVGCLGFGLEAAPSAPEREGGKGPILEAKLVERAPPSVVIHSAENRPASLDGPSSEEVLKEARKLLVEIVTILDSPNCESSGAARSFRLARAHALTLLDHLSRMEDLR
jgi:hypothetical protein